MIKQAQIAWSDGSPVSTEFDDVYFSKVSGIEETRYVFLHHNHLPDRWLNNANNHFTIAETGFGTGLNLLCAWQSFEQHSQASQTLHFVSVEKFPLSKAALKQTLTQWPELEQYSQHLLDVYPPLVAGWHRLDLPCVKKNVGKVVLHLYLGDVNDWLESIQGKIDAWFLDGFAPAKNPDMWSDHLFHSLARLSHHRSTVATFTAAGLVKRGLQKAGFTIQKVKGFGKKRDMLTACYEQTQGPMPANWLQEKPWFADPLHTFNQEQRHAVVIGAGIAGCSSAYALAKRGWQVTLLDQHDSVANGASGNAQGVLYAKLASDMNIQSEFYLSGYLYSLHLLNQTLPDRQDWDDCGVLQLAFNEKEQLRQQQFCQRFDLSEVVEWVDADQATELANIDIQNSGLYFKKGAWVHPKAWCEQLISHPNIRFIANSKVKELLQTESSWNVRCENATSFNCDVVIVCSAFEAKNLQQLSFLPTQPIAGQVTQLSDVQSNLQTVLCGDSYVTPMHKNQLNFGATYRLKSSDTLVTQADHQHNLDKLADNFPAMSTINSQKVSGRTSVRCSTPDYIPIVGPVCDEQLFKSRFHDLQKSKKWRFYEAAPYLKGLFVNLGHGSRGLSSAPLCAEMLAAQIQQEVLPICKRHQDMLSPNRFLVSQVIKGQ